MDLRVVHEFDYPADCVWEVVSNFSDISWNGPVFEKMTTEGEGVGMLRRLYVPSGSEPLVERLELLDHDNYHISFSMVGGLRVELRDYLTHVRVEALGPDRCRVDIEVHFTPPLGASDDDLHFLIQDSIDSSLRRLDHYIGQKVTASR